ncbi:Hemicentin-1 [Biomphalaria glabrata]
MFLNFWIVHSTAQQPMVTSADHDVGDTFNITCDVTRFADLKATPDRDYLSALSVFRKTFMTFMNVQIATYAPFTIFKIGTNQSNFVILFNPRGQWQFRYGGGESRKTIHVIVTAVNFQCSDAGEYSCNAIVPSGEIIFNSPVNITAKVPVSDHTMKISPHNGDDKYSSTNYVGENITLTCTVTGPPSLLITWKQTAKDSAIENPATGEISNNITTPSVVSTGCELSHYTSELKFQLQESDDGNTYYCVASNDTGEQSRGNFTLRIYPILPQQRIVTSTQHNVGDKFDITCDVTKFPVLNVTPSQDNLVGLSLVRKDSIQSGLIQIADYKPFSTVKHNNNNLPSQWLVQYSGAENSTITNRETIRIIVTAVDFQCIHAGTYTCKAELPNGEVVFSGSVKITVNAPISDHTIKINRHNGSDSYSSTNYVGENIILTCTVTGPPRLLITWKQTAKDSAIENPATGKISSNSTPPSIVSTGCDLHYYSSKLEFQLQESDDGNTYYCIASNDTGEQSRGYFTLRILPSITSTSQPKPQPAGPSVDTIFAGGLVFLAIATALTFYFIIKKKHRDSQEDTSNVETTDNDRVVSTSFNTSPQKITTKESNVSIEI